MRAPRHRHITAWCLNQTPTRGWKTSRRTHRKARASTSTLVSPRGATPSGASCARAKSPLPPRQRAAPIREASPPAREAPTERGGAKAGLPGLCRPWAVRRATRRPGRGRRRGVQARRRRGVQARPQAKTRILYRNATARSLRCPNAHAARPRPRFRRFQRAWK